MDERRKYTKRIRKKSKNKKSKRRGREWTREENAGKGYPAPEGLYTHESIWIILAQMLTIR